MERQFKSLHEIQILFAILFALLILLILIIRLVWTELKEGKRIKTDDRYRKNKMEISARAKLFFIFKQLFIVQDIKKYGSYVEIHIIPPLSKSLFHI